MLRIRKPTPDQIERFLQGQADCELTYQAVGATASVPPERYIVDRTRVHLGRGPAVFEAACEGLRQWRQFDTGWLETRSLGTGSPEPPLRDGQVVAIVARFLGLWWLNACRIVYVHQRSAEACRFGFAYGTLPAHAGTGEERFLVEMDDQDDVWFDILAFSRPRRILARLGYPLMRQLQKRFGREASSALRRFVSEHRTASEPLARASRGGPAGS